MEKPSAAAVIFEKRRRPLRPRDGPRCHGNSRLRGSLRRWGGAARVATVTLAPPRRRAGEGRGRAPRLRRARGPAACVLLCGGGKMAAHGGPAAAAALKGLIQQFTAITGEAHGSRDPPGLCRRFA